MRGRLAGLVRGVALLLTTAACAQEVQPSISAALRVDRERVFQFATFQLTVVVESAGVRLGKGLELLALPDPDRLQLGPFQELPTDRKIQTDQIREIRRYRCEGRAMQAGVLNLAPTIRATAIVQRRLLFGRQWVETPVDISVQPLPLQVLSLPTAGRPPTFSGAVGDLTFSAVATPREVAVGDLITTVMKIRGKGYLDKLVPPSFGTAPQFKVYELRPVPSGADEKVFEQILIPLSTNALAIPAVSFCFFDPLAAAYKTQTQGPFPLRFHAPKAAVEEARYRPVIARQTDSRKASAPPRLSGPKPLAFKDPAFQSLVDKASRAFADGYYQAAIDAYQMLSTRAPASAELFYNLGNASFLAGDMGSAVLNYRRCLRLSAHDADARGNLAIAMATAGAGTYAADGRDEWITFFTSWGWMMVAVLSAAAGVILLGVWILVKRARSISGGMTLTAGAVLAVALYGAAQADRQFSQEAVVMHRETARLAPAETALASFECAAGATVRVLERSGTWARVQLKGDRGWLPAPALATVNRNATANGPRSPD